MTATAWATGPTTRRADPCYSPYGDYGYDGYYNGYGGYYPGYGGGWIVVDPNPGTP